MSAVVCNEHGPPETVRVVDLPDPTARPGFVLYKGCVIKGFEIRTFAQVEPGLTARDERELIELFASGRVVPHISAVYGLDHAAEALGAVAGRLSTGKVLLRMSGPS